MSNNAFDLLIVPVTIGLFRGFAVLTLLTFAVSLIEAAIELLAGGPKPREDRRPAAVPRPWGLATNPGSDRHRPHAGRPAVTGHRSPRHRIVG